MVFKSVISPNKRRHVFLNPLNTSSAGTCLNLFLTILLLSFLNSSKQNLFMLLSRALLTMSLLLDNPSCLASLRQLLLKQKGYRNKADVGSYLPQPSLFSSFVASLSLFSSAFFNLSASSSFFSSLISDLMISICMVQPACMSFKVGQITGVFSSHKLRASHLKLAKLFEIMSAKLPCFSFSWKILGWRSSWQHMEKALNLSVLFCTKY